MDLAWEITMGIKEQIMLMMGLMITPSASHHFNFSNPSTWHNLDYTYLSLSYSVDQNTLEDHSIINGYSGLSKASWIVPIKTKYSFGLSIAPYINQKLS